MSTTISSAPHLTYLISPWEKVEFRSPMRRRRRMGRWKGREKSSESLGLGAMGKVSFCLGKSLSYSSHTEGFRSILPFPSLFFVFIVSESNCYDMCHWLCCFLFRSGIFCSRSFCFIFLCNFWYKLCCFFFFFFFVVFVFEDAWFDWRCSESAVPVIYWWFP